MTLAILSHPDCLLHEMGPEHPESPARIHAIEDRLISAGLEFALRHYPAPSASREQLLRVHDEGYVQDLFRRSPGHGLVRLDQDTFMGPRTIDAGLRAAGAAVHGVDLVMTGEVNRAFCNVRPPGHHAGPSRAMGFCFFNNVAVAAAHALAQYDVQRLAILDFDIHHGNGTQDIFRDNSRVLFCSVFQHPLYPFSGTEEVPRHIVNVPLPAGARGRDLRAALSERWFGVVREFCPELILVSAGFDGYCLDGMSDTLLCEHDYAWVTRRIRELAEACADGRVVSVLEGGYALPDLGRCVKSHLDALLGGEAV
jgi:acetoin utilization deacetylase AcuC-like enzyme